MVTIEEIIWQVVASVPRGQVATYGQVARLAGYPEHARYVGRVLGKLPEDTALPWHRVVNARGEISLARGSRACSAQLARLRGEGIELKGSTLDLKRFGWKPRDSSA